MSAEAPGSVCSAFRGSSGTSTSALPVFIPSTSLLRAPSATGSLTAAGATGVWDASSACSFPFCVSLFFSSVLRNTFMVVRKALFGLQSSALTGSCAQTGQASGRDVWPCSRSARYFPGSLCNASQEEGVLTILADRLLAAWQAERVDR